MSAGNTDTNWMGLYSQAFYPGPPTSPATRITPDPSDNLLHFSCPDDRAALGGYYLMCAAANTAGKTCTGSPWCKGWLPDGYPPPDTNDPTDCLAVGTGYTDCYSANTTTQIPNDVLEVTCNCKSFEDNAVLGNVVTNACDTLTKWNNNDLACKTTTNQVTIKLASDIKINGYPATNVDLVDTNLVSNTSCQALNDPNWSGLTFKTYALPYNGLYEVPFDLDPNIAAHRVCVRYRNTYGDAARCAGQVNKVNQYTISGTVYQGSTCWATGSLTGTMTGRVNLIDQGSGTILQFKNVSNSDSTYSFIGAEGVDYYLELVNLSSGWNAKCPLPATQYISIPSLSANQTKNIVIEPIAGPQAWWQTYGGDLGANKDRDPSPNVYSDIPNNSSFLSVSTPSTASGMLLYVGSVVPDFGTGLFVATTNPNWQVNASFDILNNNLEDFDYFRRLVDMLVIDNGHNDNSKFNPSGKPDLSQMSGITNKAGVYGWNGDLTISDWNTPYDVGNGLTQEKIVIFINGNLTINTTEFKVKNTHFLLFVVSGNIIINPSVTTLEGIYVANGTIQIGTSGQNLDSALKANGMFIGWGDGGGEGIDFGRNLANDSLPAEVFTFRPDFLVNAPDFLKKHQFYWQEITPFQ
jgi:hypothetical protein